MACHCRVVFIGCAGSADCGTPNINWAMTFCPNNTMSLCVGAHGATLGQAGASSGLSYIRTYTLLAVNTQYAFNGFATLGTNDEGFAGAWPCQVVFR
jgi:hypothetical protein